jgi:hypothetical protein
MRKRTSTPADLNRFSYALARATRQSLPLKGADFTQPDVASVPDQTTRDLLVRSCRLQSTSQSPID